MDKPAKNQVCTDSLGKEKLSLQTMTLLIQFLEVFLLLTGAELLIKKPTVRLVNYLMFASSAFNAKLSP